MSKFTLSRIPIGVQHIFKVYETAAQVYRPYDDKLVSQFVDKSGSYYDRFNRRKLLSGIDTHGVYTPIFNSRDFPPVIRDIVAKVFETPLQLEKKLHLPTIEQTSALDDPLFSDSGSTAKHFSNYQAKILSLFASYYSPLAEATSPSAQKSLKWYKRLLANTPVVFFLRQKQRLMTESSLRGINQPLTKLRSLLGSICRRYVVDPDLDKRIRNYHLTDLVTTDIFRLAVDGSAKNKGEILKPVLHETVHYPDRLCSYLHELREPTVLGPKQIPMILDTITSRSIISHHSIPRIEAAIENWDDTKMLSSIFPYDIRYNDLYMLTIEEPIFNDSHQDLLELLENQKDFHVFAARVSKSDALLFDFAPNTTPSTYDQLLQMAEKRLSTTDHILQLLQRIGEWGLVEVEDSACNTAFYVFEETKKESEER